MMHLRQISISLAVIMAVGCSTGNNWKHYGKLYEALPASPDSVLTVLESIDTAATSGDRQKAEYRLLKALAFDMAYGFPEISEKKDVEKSISVLSGGGKGSVRAATLGMEGKYALSEKDYETAVSLLTKALENINWGRDDFLAVNFCRDIALCYRTSGVEIDNGLYLYYAYRGLYEGRQRSERIRLGALLLFFLAVTATLFWFFKARKIAAQKVLEQEKAETEKYMNIAEDLQKKVTRMKGSSAMSNEVLERLCGQYYVNEGSDRLQGSVIREVKSIIDGLRNDPKVQKNLEDNLNASSDNVMVRLREAFPKWKEEDFQIYAYTASGFSSTTIATLLEKDKPFVYNRLYRLKTRISSSEHPDKEQFLSILQ